MRRAAGRRTGPTGGKGGGGARGAWLAALALAVFAVGEALLLLPASHPAARLIADAELDLYDYHARALPTLPPDDRVVIVAMDDETLEQLPGLEEYPFYPLPRDWHASLTDALTAAGAKAVGFDVMFPTSRAGDDAFARALARRAARRGVTVAAATPEEIGEDGGGGERRVTFRPPAPTLGPHLAPANIQVPRGVIRWVSPYRTDDARPGVRYPHLGLALAAAYRDAPADGAVPVLRRDGFRWGPRLDAPVVDVGPPGDEAQLLVRYAGPAGSFPTVPYWEAATGAWRETRPADFFRGKIVLVGRVHPQEDVQLTPRGAMPGVEVHANIARMALTGTHLRRVGSEQAAMGCGALLCLLYLLALWRLTLAPAALLSLLLGAGWAALAHRLFVGRGLWIDTLPPLLLLGGCVGATAVYEGFRMRRQFAAFVPTWVADRVLTGRGGAAVGGAGASAERPVTVVFCDVRDFTTIAEERPDAAIELLRRFYEAADDAARRHGTELDKFIGDEILLYFRDDGDRRLRRRGRGREPHPLRAVRWAAEMQEAARALDATGLAGATGFRVGVGIATGVAREGFIGTRRRVQSTVIGDVVNLASRLQQATRTLERPILVSEGTFSQLGGAIPAEPLGRISVKGRQESVAVYAPYPTEPPATAPDDGTQNSHAAPPPP